ncbi:hypothetical protein O9992_16440 [Vibrio lentus]|nr:hypothetical protein [Vibrio lentus]
MTEDVEMGIGYQLGEIEDDENITAERESISFNAHRLIWTTSP